MKFRIVKHSNDLTIYYTVQYNVFWVFWSSFKSYKYNSEGEIREFKTFNAACAFLQKWKHEQKLYSKIVYEE